MKTPLLILLIFVFAACSDEDQQCRPIRALSGYVPSPTSDVVMYDRESVFFYDGSLLQKKEEYSLDPRELVTITEFFYENGQLSKEFVVAVNSNQEYHYYYTISASTWTKTVFVINGADTLDTSEEVDFYVENPDDKVYRDKLRNQSFKYQDGNVIEYGSYEVIADDTVDNFYERYEYDTHENFVKTIAYRSTIPNGFKWSILPSRNNLIHGEYIGVGGQGWQRSYSFRYDAERLIQYKDLNTGLTVDFEYQCD